MSLSDEINSFETEFKRNIRIKCEGLPSVPATKELSKEVETISQRRVLNVLTPSRLSIDKYYENRHQFMLLSTQKRISEDDSPDKSNKELSPLYKRIKKENNNCLLLDSKQFIEQELDTELDFNTRQPFVGLFSKLSLDRTCIPSPESSNSYPLNTSSEANALSDVLKNMNICNKSIENSEQINTSLKTKKKKNKKSKKSREKKLKISKNVFKSVYSSKTKVKSNSFSHKKESKGQHLFKIQSSIIKELKVSASGGLSADEVQTLLILRNEGIVRKHRKKHFKCLLCKHRMTDIESSEDHIKSNTHLENSSEQRLSKLDSKLVFDLGKIKDIEALLARRRILSQMTNKTKELLYSKGIRVKDGFGSHTFVCIDCSNENFESLEAVFDHINAKSKLIDGFTHICLDSEAKQELNSNTSLNNNPFHHLTGDQLNQLLLSEGVVRKQCYRKKKWKYFCNLCRKSRNNETQIKEHIIGEEHLSHKKDRQDSITTLENNKIENNSTIMT